MQVRGNQIVKKKKRKGKRKKERKRKKKINYFDKLMLNILYLIVHESLGIVLINSIFYEFC